MALTTLAVAATVGSAAIGANAAKKSAKAQRDAANQANQTISEQNALIRQDLSPYRDLGNAAADRLGKASTGDMSQFFASPDYMFRQQQGTKNIGNSFAARGGAFSGNALKALTEYNSGLAANEYGNWWQRQQGLVNTGNNAAAQTGTFGQNAANNMAVNTVGAGNAQASGILSSANAYAGALSTLGGGFASGAFGSLGANAGTVNASGLTKTRIPNSLYDTNWKY